MVNIQRCKARSGGFIFNTCFDLDKMTQWVPKTKWLQESYLLEAPNGAGWVLHVADSNYYRISKREAVCFLRFYNYKEKDLPEDLKDISGYCLTD